MDTFFRIARQGDISAILAMMQDFYAIDDYPFDEKNSLNNLELFIMNEHLGRFWLIKKDKKIIGYLILTFGFSFEFGGRDAFVDELFIKKEFRGKGVGQQCMNFLEKEAIDLDIKAIHLEVESHNENANRLYLKNGFKGNNRFLLTKRLE